MTTTLFFSRCTVSIPLLTVFLSLYGDEAVIPKNKNCDLSAVPRLNIPLVQHDNKEQEEKHLADVKAIVDKALVNERKKQKKSGAQKNKIASQLQGKNNYTEQKISPELANLLQQEFNDPILQSTIVSLQGKKLPIKEAINLLSASSNISFVVDANIDSVLPKINLTNIPLSAALASLVQSSQPRLALIKDFGIWRITTLATAIEIVSSREKIKKEVDYQSGIVSIQHASWNDNLRTKIKTLWEGITKNDPDQKNAYLVFDDVNKKLYFRAQKGHVSEFNRCLEELDRYIPQIRLEIRVVSAEKDFDEIIGFEWSGLYDRHASVKHFDFVGLGPYLTDAASNSFFKNLMPWSLNFIPTGGTPNIKIPLVFGNNDLTTKRLNLYLNAAENRREIKTILKPSLLVHNEDAAEILVGEEVPLEVRLDETVEGKLTNVTTVNFKDVGMKIKVKPSVTPNANGVFLEIFVENSKTKPADIGDTKSKFNYTIETTRSASKVLLKSGQTTMISGLISKMKENVRTGVPYLQDIPIIGWFFKGSRKTINDKQLLIFITPTVV